MKLPLQITVFAFLISNTVIKNLQGQLPGALFIEEPQNASCNVGTNVTFSCIPTAAEYMYWIINGIQASILCKQGNCWYSSYTLRVRCNEEFDEAQIVCGIIEGNSTPAYLVVIMEISTTHNKPITGKISSLTSHLHTWSHYLCLCTCMHVHTHT